SSRQGSPLPPPAEEGPGQQPGGQPQAGTDQGGGLLGHGQLVPAEDVPDSGGHRPAPGRTAPSQPERRLVEWTGMPRPRASTIRPRPTTIATCRRDGPGLREITREASPSP